MKQQHLLLMVSLLLVKVSLLVAPAAAWCLLPRPCLSSPQRRFRSYLLPLAARSWQGGGDSRSVANNAGRSTSLGRGGGDVRAPLNEIPDATLFSPRRATLGKECE